MSAEGVIDDAVAGPLAPAKTMRGWRCVANCRWRGWWRWCVAVGAGVLVYLSFPPRSWWPLAPVSLAVLIAVLRTVNSKKAGFGCGLAAGLGFFVPLLPWIGSYVGPLPWLALSLACAVYIGIFGAMTTVLLRLPGWPVWVGLAWTTVEWARSNFPFGGFPWGRLAFGQASGWYLPYAAFGGAPLMGFLVASTGASLAAVMGRRPQKGMVALVVAVLVPVFGLGLRAVLPHPAAGDRTITVAAIQGSVPRLGLEFNAQRRAVLDNHIRRTEQLASDIAAGRFPHPDLVVWPENASDVDPLRDPDAAAGITEAARRINAPILVGAVLVNEDHTTTNSVLVWTPEGGITDRHDKKIIQPFGEYLPWRGFFRLFSEYADLAGHFVPGQGNGTVSAGGIRVGVATCYEVVFDRALRESVSSGATLLTVPTNNATFGKSDMTYQQLAMSQVRAVEHSRALVVAATSGVSAVMTADGVVRQRSDMLVPAALVARVPVRSSITLADRLGGGPELGAVALTVTALLVGVFRARDRKPRLCPVRRQR